MIEVYVLKDPDTGIIRYVGITGNPKARISSHKTFTENSKSSRKGLFGWLRELHAAGKTPIYEGWKSFRTRRYALKEERFWIEFLRDQGVELLNINLG